MPEPIVMIPVNPGILSISGRDIALRTGSATRNSRFGVGRLARGFGPAITPVAKRGRRELSRSEKLIGAPDLGMSH